MTTNKYDTTQIHKKKPEPEPPTEAYSDCQLLLSSLSKEPERLRRAVQALRLRIDDAYTYEHRSTPRTEALIDLLQLVTVKQVLNSKMLQAFDHAFERKLNELTEHQDQEIAEAFQKLLETKETKHG